jgi:hypothetical protein
MKKWIVAVRRLNFEERHDCALGLPLDDKLQGIWKPFWLRGLRSEACQFDGPVRDAFLFDNEVDARSKAVETMLLHGDLFKDCRLFLKEIDIPGLSE